MTSNTSPRGILWLSLPTQVAPAHRLFPNLPNHVHVTLQFGVSREDIPEAVLGRLFPVTFVANCYNDRVQALRVELPEEVRQLCNNEHPHMTVSMADGVRPVESNAMLAGEHVSEPVNLELLTVCEFQPFN